MKAPRLTTPGTVLAESELVLDARGAVYHLSLRPEEIGDLILVAGDPGRIERISARFDAVEFRTSNREFVTHTGRIGSLRISAIATGIGTDNIDIVLNELDALVNIDLEQRTPKPSTKSLRIIRLGTCGALQPDIPVDRLVVSSFGLGLDNVLHYYANSPSQREEMILDALKIHMKWPSALPAPYLVEGAPELVEQLSPGQFSGITATAGGFYGPQGRQLRLEPAVNGFNERLSAFAHDELRVMNYEMETSALYGLSALLGHQACTVCTVIANRSRREYSADHHKSVEAMIDHVIERSTGT